MLWLAPPVMKNVGNCAFHSNCTLQSGRGCFSLCLLRRCLNACPKNHFRDMCARAHKKPPCKRRREAQDHPNLKTPRQAINVTPCGTYCLRQYTCNYNISLSICQQLFRHARHIYLNARAHGRGQGAAPDKLSL